MYFAVSSFNPYRRQSHVLFFLMAFFAANQLLAELSRYMFSYAYPMHDVRLLLIVSFAMGFGCSLWVYNVRKFAEQHKALWIGGGIALTLATVLMVTGFDTKTSTAILMPALLSTLLIAYRLTQQRSPTLWLFLLVYGLLSAAIQLSLGRFHDSLFYYLISLVLGFLFVQQAQELSKEQARRKTEEQQVAKLQLKLDNIQPLQSRVEEHQPEQGYDGVISRAFASINDMLSWCRHLPAQNGRFFAMKGAAVQEEIAALPDFVKVASVQPLSVPQLHAQRHLVILDPC